MSRPRTGRAPGGAVDAESESSSGAPVLLRPIDRDLKRNYRSRLTTRPYYSSEEEKEETNSDSEEPPPPPSSQAATEGAVAAESATAAVMPRARPEMRTFSRRRGASASTTAAAGTAAASSSSRSACSARTLTERIFARHGPRIHQWQIPLAVARGPPADLTTRGYGYVVEEVPIESAAAAAAGSSSARPAKKAKMEPLDDDAETKAFSAAMSESTVGVAPASGSVKNRPSVPVAYSRPFDIQRPPDATPTAAGGGGGMGGGGGPGETRGDHASADSKSRYWVYKSKQIQYLRGDPGYTITDHGGYTDAPVERASPSLTAQELDHLTPVSAGDACRHMGMTLIRDMRVKVKHETLAEIHRSLRTVTGEFDRKVLTMCEHANMNKCQVYRTDDYNYTLMSTQPILSGEPLGAWMGTLRERNTFEQRVGFVTSMTHIWAYDIAADEMPPGYDGPDLVIDALEYGNESKFFRDPKWSHQQADANVTVRLVWNQKVGLPYLMFVARDDIAAHAELFLDWGDTCWKHVWRTQLTALANHSHRAHIYLRSLQSLLISANLHPLPQLAHSKFAAMPKSEREQKEEQQRFLAQQVDGYPTVSQVTRGEGEAVDISAPERRRKKWGTGPRKKVKSKKENEKTKTEEEAVKEEDQPMTDVASTAAVAAVEKEEEEEEESKQPHLPPAALTVGAPSTSKSCSLAAYAKAIYDDMPELEPAEAATTAAATTTTRRRSSTKMNLDQIAELAALSSSSPATAMELDSIVDSSLASSSTPAADASAAAATSTSSALPEPPKTRSTRSSLQIDTSFRPPPTAASPLASSPASELADDASTPSSAPSSPYTPAFTTHKAFRATDSHTMLTVFASAMLHECLREQARIRRRLHRHRLRRFQSVRRPPKPLLAGAQHVFGPHAFQLVTDVDQAFFQSGTRLARETKACVSDDTKGYIKEAFDLLRPIDFPVGRDSKLIHSGTVPKSAVYEVVSLRHPARFFTRPDQTPFSLVATERYARDEAIGAYIGVCRDFHAFHRASNHDAMKQVFAYDCHAQQIPGPPNPWLSEEEKRMPVHEQLAYRGGDLIVESLYYGNEIRYMNDSYGRSGMDGTVNAYATIAWDRARAWPCILIRALFPIPRGEEIVCDYGDAFWNKVARSLMIDHARYGDEVRQVIQHTEEWITANGLQLPPRDNQTTPTPAAADGTGGDGGASNRREPLPSLFTRDIRQKEVIYPRFFLKEVGEDEEDDRVEDADDGGCARASRWLLSEEDARRALEDSRRQAAEYLQRKAVEMEAAAAEAATGAAKEQEAHAKAEKTSTEAAATATPVAECQPRSDDEEMQLTDEPASPPAPPYASASSARRSKRDRAPASTPPPTASAVSSRSRSAAALHIASPKLASSTGFARRGVKRQAPAPASPSTSSSAAVATTSNPPAQLKATNQQSSSAAAASSVKKNKKKPSVHPQPAGVPARRELSSGEDVSDSDGPTVSSASSPAPSTSGRQQQADPHRELPPSQYLRLESDSQQRLRALVSASGVAPAPGRSRGMPRMLLATKSIRAFM